MRYSLQSSEEDVNPTLLTAGIACLVASIVGGGLKAFGIEIPVVNSLKRQLTLGTFGAVLLIAGAFVEQPPQHVSQSGSQSTDHPTEPTATDRAGLLAELNWNHQTMTSLQSDEAVQNEHISDLTKQISVQRQNVAELRGMIARGEGTPEEVARAREEISRAEDQIERTESGIRDARTVIDRAHQRVASLQTRNEEIERLLQ